MPRIRKKTSKRGTTHQRTKIKQKVAESHKKSKKEAKKNTQWKSKHKKELGIPNNFPYKDQILAEIAEERRKEKEAKDQAKVKKKQAKAGTANEEEVDNGEEFDGIASVSRTAITPEQSNVSAKGKQKAKADEEDEVEDVPILINNEYVNLAYVLSKADVVLEVLDARDPLAYHSTHLAHYLKEKKVSKLMCILNKIDTCPRESIQAWLPQLRAQQPTLLFRSASAFLPNNEAKQPQSLLKSRAKAPADNAVGIEGILKALESEAKKRKTDKLVVAIVGVANTGKSSIINSLIRKSVSPTYKLTSATPGPSTTERPLEVSLEHEGKEFLFIDTPAFSWDYTTASDGNSESADQQRARDVLLRSRGRIDKAKDPISVVAPLIERANTEDLMLLYTLPAFSKGSAPAFLSALAKSKDLVKKAGELDQVSAARIVLRDWSTEAFPYYAAPPTSTTGLEPKNGKKSDTSSLSDVYAMDEKVLEAATSTRKEMKKGQGLVRLAPSEAEKRRIALETRWDEETKSDEGSDEDEDDEGAGEEGIDQLNSEGDSEEGDDSDEADEDEENGAEEDSSPPPQRKRKRQGKADTASSRKKVAFNVESKDNKKGRPLSRAKPSPTKGKKNRKGRA